MIVHLFKAINYKLDVGDQFIPGFACDESSVARWVDYVSGKSQPNPRRYATAFWNNDYPVWIVGFWCIADEMDSIQLYSPNITSVDYSAMVVHIDSRIAILEDGAELKVPSRIPMVWDI